MNPRSKDIQAVSVPGPVGIVFDDLFERSLDKAVKGVDAAEHDVGRGGGLVAFHEVAGKRGEGRFANTAIAGEEGDLESAGGRGPDELSDTRNLLGAANKELDVGRLSRTKRRKVWVQLRQSRSLRLAAGGRVAHATGPR